LPNATTGANLACTRPNLDALIASTLKKRVTVKVDCAALQMALDQVLKHDPDPDRREQVCAMLERDGWWEAASFAAFHCQCQALRGPLQLKPWQSPPCFGEVPYASTAPQLRSLFNHFPVIVATRSGRSLPFAKGQRVPRTLRSCGASRSISFVMLKTSAQAKHIENLSAASLYRPASGIFSSEKASPPLKAVNYVLRL
jgi:hypothetical protein